MAKFTRKTLNHEEAKAVLGETWRFALNDGRDSAYFFTCMNDKYLRPDLYHFDKDEATLVCEGEMEVENQPLWPHWNCRIDLTNFYTNGDNILHPLTGFYIPELIEATNYPFHNKKRVRAILAYNEHYFNCLLLNHRAPDVVIFVETWSHYDDLAQLSPCSPETVFRTYDGSGLSMAQLSSEEHHIGKNFIMMPLGYNHGKTTTTGDVERWKDIIQRFLDGETDSEKATEDTHSPESVLSTIDNTAAAVETDYFAKFQKDLAEKYRDEFLSMTNVNEAAEHEAYLGEAEDKNGVLLYTVAVELEPVDALRYYETINGVCYLVRRYNYCQAHLEKLEIDLIELMAHEEQF